MPITSIDYGMTTLEVELPDDAVVVEPGRSYEDPPTPDPVAATEAAIADPVDMPPLRELARGARRVAVVFPDRVKGGTQEASHRKNALPIVLRELDAAGVPLEGISLICAIGLHRMNTREEMAEYLPHDVIDRFGPDQLLNHDAEDPDGIVDLGISEHGDVVQFNRRCAEADLTVVLGHAQGNPYGGFSGGYKTYTTGLTTWRSIAGHHVPSTMHRPDFVPISTRSHFRSQLRAIGQRIEDTIAGPLFVIDAVVGLESRVLGVAAGSTRAVEEATWTLAERRTNVVVDGPPADIVLFGLPRDFHYGPGMGTNPILMSQAIASTMTRAAGALRPDGVVIAAALCNGWFNDEWFPSYEETFERYRKIMSVADMGDAVDDLCHREDHIRAYRERYAYHPFHAFSMLSMAEIARKRASAIFVPGAEAPEYARSMGLTPTATVDEALSEAEKLVGGQPRILALPGFLRNVPPHLFASDPER